MSSENFIAYFGLRFELRSDELEAVELRSDHRVSLARKNGLKHYFGNFGAHKDRYLLFIGHELGILGAENASEISISPVEMNGIIELTATKIRVAGYLETPGIYLCWQPDA